MYSAVIKQLLILSIPYLKLIFLKIHIKDHYSRYKNPHQKIQPIIRCSKSFSQDQILLLKYVRQWNQNMDIHILLKMEKHFKN